jgi:hypothetical protein
LGVVVVLSVTAKYQERASQPATNIHPESFGAKGDGIANDTAALQAAINAAPISGSGAEIILSRRYRITAPLEIINDAAHGHRAGLTIKGLNAAPGGLSHQTGIVWAGPGNQPIIKLHSRENLLRNFAIFVADRHTASAAIEIDQVPGMVANTRNTFEYLWIDGGLGLGTSGRLQNGVVIGPRSGVSNLDFMYFRQVFISHILEACVDIRSDTGQSKHNTFEQCAFLDAKYGIKQNTGSFEAYGCSFSSLRTAAISLYAPTDNIYITNPDSEGCPRFIESRAGGEAGWPLVISGGRFEMDNLATDGRYIDYHYSGPLTIQGATFSNVSVPRFRIRAGAGGAGARLLSFGNQFPNQTPYELTTTAKLSSLGNRGLNARGRAVLLADQ